MSKIPKALVGQVTFGIIGLALYSIILFFVLKGMILEYAISNSDNFLPSTTIIIKIILLISIAWLFPLLFLLWATAQSIPGAFSVTLCDDDLKLRTLLRMRHIPRGSITYIGLRQGDAWLVHLFPTLARPPDFDAKGRPPPTHRLNFEYYQEQINGSQRKHIIKLPVLFSENTIHAIQSWAGISTKID